MSSKLKNPLAKKFERQSKAFSSLEGALAFSGNYLMAEVAKGLSEVCQSLAKVAEEAE